jgi:hypothetical protein
MNRRYQHRPGLFGLASIAAGCSPKGNGVRAQQDSSSTDRHHQEDNFTRSLSRKKAKIRIDQMAAQPALGIKVRASGAEPV